MVTYESTDAQTKENCNRGNALERSVEKLLGVVVVGVMVQSVKSCKTSPLNLMQLQIT